MNKLIQDQLNKVKVANIPPYSSTDTEIVIPKNINNVINLDSLQVGHYYKIVVAEYIIKPFEGFTLHDNWNKGIIPTDNQMNAEIVQFMGKMVYINALGINDNKPWTGWLPIKSILKFERLE